MGHAGVSGTFTPSLAVKEQTVQVSSLTHVQLYYLYQLNRLLRCDSSTSADSCWVDLAFRFTLPQPENQQFRLSM